MLATNLRSPQFVLCKYSSQGKYFFTWHRSYSTVKSPDLLVVLVGWLGCTQRRLDKYSEIYAQNIKNRNVDIVTFIPPFKSVYVL